MKIINTYIKPSYDAKPTSENALINISICRYHHFENYGGNVYSDEASSEMKAAYLRSHLLS